MLRLSVLALLPLCAVASPQGSDPANPSQMDKKKLEAKAKALVAEGKLLEKQGTLDEARERFVDAEGYLSTKDALKGIDRIRDSNEKQVQALLASAHQSYDAGKFSDCAEKLEKGLAISSVNPALHYNLALCYEKLKERTQAVEHLDSAITAARDKNLRANMIQLRGNLLLGVAPVAAAGDARKKIDTFNATYLQADRDAAGGAASGENKGAASGSLCDQIKELQATSPQSPAILFNAAKCAEADGRAGDAARLLGEYLKRRVKLTKAQKKTSRHYQKTAAASETLSAPYVRRQLDRAREDLSEAEQLFPIGVEANEMLALADLENNDWPSVYSRYDAMASAGLPVSFYAQVSSSKDNKVVRAAKVEIGKDTMHLVYLSSYNVKKKISEPPEEPAGDDDLGNLITSTALPPDPKVEGLSIPLADIQGV